MEWPEDGKKQSNQFSKEEGKKKIQPSLIC